MHRPDQPKSHWYATWHRAAFAALLIIVVWAPLPLGSNRPWAVALLAMLTWGLLLANSWVAWLAGQRLLRGHWAVPIIPLACFAAIAGAQWLQPSALQPWLSTLDAHATKVHLLTTLAHLAGAALVVQLVTTAKRTHWLLGGLAAAGLLQALLAIGLASAGNGHTLWHHSFGLDRRTVGTFPNPDHLAGYLEVCLAAGFGLLIAQFASADAADKQAWRQRAAGALSFFMSSKMLLRLMLVVMVVALVMTHSRMGNGAFFMSLMAIGALLAWKSPQMRRRALWLVASMALIDVLVIGQWVGLDRVVNRLESTVRATANDAKDDSASAMTSGAAISPPTPAPQEQSLQQRMEVPSLSAPLVLSKPWFGHGGGSYRWAFAPVKPPGYPNHWDHAHNDLVEIAIDSGLLGLACLLGLAWATMWRATKHLGDHAPRHRRGAAVAAWLALLSLGLHAMVDFNLQIPATAFTLVLLAALVWAAPPASAGSR